jgi:hypothetical protein
MEFVLIKIQSEAWNEMWDWLKAHPINSGLELPDLALNPETNSGWQYIGSYKNRNKVISEFIHQKHPVTQKPEKVSYSHSNEVGPDQIQLTRKI